MAAYGALSSLSEATELLLHKIVLQKTDGGFSRILPLKNEIEFLRGNINFLLYFLGKSPNSRFEAQIKDTADQAQVIIGRFVLDHLRSELTADDVTLKSLSHQLQIIHGDLISSMVEKINNDVSETNEESVGIFNSSPSTTIPLPLPDLVSINAMELLEIDRHFSDESSTELRVVSIVGMGGIGKTTLARRCYNHHTMSELFEIIGWVTVSKDYSARDILFSLMASIQPYIRQPKQSNESIENYVHNNLKGRRFFIVLDDVWSPEVLRFLMKTFPDDGNRSSILITTRQDEVAVEANPEKPMRTIQTKHMNPEQSQVLLRLALRGDHCPPELEDLLRSIAMVCDGLPLAVILVAGILSASYKSLHEWDYIFKKLSVDYESRHEMVDAILSLSYKHLPHHLRSCLLYMGAFPEDRHINVARLTKQLSAQSFHQKLTSHEVEQCVHYLVNRNLVSIVRIKPDFRIKTVCLHDMVRDFCAKKAREEEFFHIVTDDDDSDRDSTGSKVIVGYNLDNLKHICNNSDDADYDTHTIICFGSGWTRRRSLISVGRFRLLKSLDLPNVEVESFPIEVLNLSLLRLLVLGHVPELPQSISNLRYLETLIINTSKDASPSSSSLTTLPRILCVPFEIWTMSQLRHVVSFCCGPLQSPNMEENSPLENLETLSAVMNLDCSEDLIRMIPNVTKLGMFYFGVERATHSIENIERLSRLEKLKVWVMVPFSSPQNLNLGFPTTLRRLTLRGVRLSHRDMQIIGGLPSLQVLKLRRNDFEGDEWRVTTAHGFQMLEYLLLEELGLRLWLPDSDDGFVFPMLRWLVIRNCKELGEIDMVLQNIPSLHVIEVVGCKKKSLVESVRRMKLSIKVLQVVTRYYSGI